MGNSMEEENTGDEAPVVTGPLTWIPAPGIPVYGFTPATAPPDLAAPWSGPTYSLAPPAAPPPPQSPVEPVYASPLPPAIPAAPAILNPAIGAAVTPQERAAQLGISYPPPDNPRAE